MSGRGQAIDLPRPCCDGAYAGLIFSRLLSFSPIILLLAIGQTGYCQTAAGPAEGLVPRGVQVSTNDLRLQRATEATAVECVRPRVRRFPESVSGGSQFVLPAAPEGSNYQRDPAASSSLTSFLPIVLESFEGIPQTNSYPPDPQVAAGPAFLLEAVNRTFRICDKSGGLVVSIDAAAWFASALPGAAPFDPRVQYDHFAHRWVMLWHHQSYAPRSSYYLLSISDDEDPRGTWYNWTLPADVNGVDASGNWADNGCLGLDSLAFYVASDQYSYQAADFDYVKVRIIPKTQLYANTAGLVRWTDFWDLHDPTGRSSFHVRPAIVHGASSEFYLMDVPQEKTGTYGTVYRIGNPVTQPSLSAVAVPLTQWTRAPNALQPGDPFPLDVGGSTLQGEIHFMDNSIWGAHAVANPDGGGRSSVHYFRVNTLTNAAVEDLVFGDPRSWYSYPGLVVDAKQNLAITFTRSGVAEYPSACMTWRLSGDPPGVRPELTMQQGWAQYQRRDPDGTNRWGDYNAAVLDPIDGQSLWLMTEYAEAPSNTWGTWVTNVRLIPFSGPKVTSDSHALDLGYVDLGKSSDTARVVMKNVGTAPISISGATVRTSFFRLVNPPSAPVLIPTNDSLALRLFFVPGFVGPSRDTLLLTTNDPADPSMKIALRGNGVVVDTAAEGCYVALVDRSGSRLYELRDLSGNPSLIGSMAVGDVRSLTIRQSDRQLYGIAPDRRGMAIFRADAKTGQVYPRKVLGLWNLSVIAFDPSDVLYGGTTSGELYRIDLSGGNAALVGKAQGMEYSGLSFNPHSGSLWATTGDPFSNDTLYRVSTIAGSATPLGSAGFSTRISSLSHGPRGKLYGLVENALVTFDTANGRGSFLRLIALEGLRALAMRSDLVTGLSGDGGLQVPGSFDLSQNYPNPFNPWTTIRFRIANSGSVTLAVFDLLGREVAVLLNERRAPGSYEATFDASSFPSGVYFYRLSSSGSVMTRTMVLVR
jgi:hypothetical protein